MTDSLIIVLILLVTIILLLSYSLIMKKNVSTSEKTNTVFLVIVFSISLVVKLVIYLTISDYSIANTSLDVVSNILKAIYATLGGLTFEGLEVFDSSFKYLLYVWSSLIAGVFFLLYCSSKLNYGFRCAFKMPFQYKKNKNIYIFNSLTNNSITLAKSIKSKDKKAYIVFAGPHLQSFDNKDPLCRELANNNFLYRSYVEDNITIPISKKLELKNRNHLDFKKSYCVFAFEEDEKGYPIEDNNLKIVIDDIDIRYEKIKKTKEKLLQSKLFLNNKINSTLNKKQIIEYIDELIKVITKHLHKEHRIDYFILTSTNLNNEIYTSHLADLSEEFIVYNNLIKELIGLISKSDYEKEIQKKYNFNIRKLKEELTINLYNYFQIQIVSESNLMARDLISKLNNNDYYLKKQDSISLLENICYRNKLYVWCLGFGDIGQALMEALYVHSSYVDSNGKCSHFKASCFDEKMDTKKGLYKRKRPYYVFDHLRIFDEILIDNSLSGFKNFLIEKENIHEKCQKLQSTMSTLTYPIDNHIVSTIITEYEDIFKLCGKESILALVNTKDKDFFELGKKRLNNDLENIEALYSKQLSAYLSLINKKRPLPVINEKYIESLYEFLIDEKYFIPDNKKSDLLRLKKEFSGYGLPEIDFENISCSSNEFIVALDSVVGVTDNTERPNVFIVALGSDYENIDLANIILDDIREEVTLSKKSPKQSNQIIIVKIREIQNRLLLHWFPQDNELFTNIRIVIVGNTVDLFSYEQFFENDQAKLFNSTYNLLYDSSYGIKSNDNLDLQLLRDFYSWKKEYEIKCYDSQKEYFKIIEDSLKDDLLASQSLNIDKDWIKLDSFKKESNIWSCVFMPVYQILKERVDNEIVNIQNAESFIEVQKASKRYQNDFNDILSIINKEYKEDFKTIDDAFKTHQAKIKELIINKHRCLYYKQIVNITHHRWFRFHIINGWRCGYKYNKEGILRNDKLAKYHNCLVPMPYVPENTILFDLIPLNLMNIQKKK